MNQILSVEMSSKKSKKKKANIRSIIIFFCIMILIFGISMIVIGIISNLSKGNSGESNINKPKINIIQNISKLNVTVECESQISNVVYKWNNEAETKVNGNNDNSMSLEIKIPIGKNVLSITATDVNGLSQTYENEYIGVEEYTPTISLTQENNTITVKCESSEIIKQISYFFDQEEEKVQEINNLNGEISIDVKEGEHKLTLKVINEKGQEYKDERSIYVPVVSVVTDGERFIIKAEDTRGISKVKINLNNVENEKEINDKKYEDSLVLSNGENRLILVVTNTDGLSMTRRIRYEKK